MAAPTRVDHLLVMALFPVINDNNLQEWQWRDRVLEMKSNWWTLRINHILETSNNT